MARSKLQLFLRACGLAGMAVMAAACGAASVDSPRDDDVGVARSGFRKGDPRAKLGDANYCDDPNHPCTAGEGDCDSSDGCEAGLVCGRSKLVQFGFPGGDACVPAHCTNKRRDADETQIDCGGSCGSVCSAPVCRENGFGERCTTDCLCAAGEGDCDSSDECEAGLVCGRSKLVQFGFPGGDACVPAHCANKIRDADETQIDCGGSCGTTCAPPVCGPNGSGNRCTTDCLCGIGEGDCDSSDQCEAGLVCGRGKLAHFGFPGDACVPAHCTNWRLDPGETAIDCGGDCGSVGCTSNPSCPDVELRGQLPIQITASTHGKGDRYSPSCGADPADYVATFTAPAAGLYRFSAPNINPWSFDTSLAIFDGGCGTRELACNNDFGSAVNLQLAEGQTVTAVVEQWGEGGFVLTVSREQVSPCCTSRGGAKGCVDTAVQDCVCGGLVGQSECCTTAWDENCDWAAAYFGCAACIPSPPDTCPAVELGPLPSEITGTTSGEKHWFASSCASDGGTGGQHITTFKAPSTGTYVFSTAGSAYDTVLTVTDGACGGVELACNDDSGAGGSSEVTVALTTGQVVTIVVGGKAGSEGDFVLSGKRYAIYATLWVDATNAIVTGNISYEGANTVKTCGVLGARRICSWQIAMSSRVIIRSESPGMTWPGPSYSSTPGIACQFYPPTGSPGTPYIQCVIDSMDQEDGAGVEIGWTTAP